MVTYSFPYFSPSINQLAMYSHFLANTFPAPATIRNYISGACTWVQLHGGNITSFLAPEMATMTKAIKEKSSHVVAPAPPLTPGHIKIICNFIASHPGSLITIKAALLLAYTTFLQASNVVSPSLNQWGGPHTLRAGDVCQAAGGLRVIVRSTKTRSRSAPHAALILPAEDPLLCPVRAWYRYKAVVNPCPLGPAFMVSPSKPLTANMVVAVIRTALAWGGIKDPGAFSFHSLRRGAAQAAAFAGASEEDVMQHGMWSSREGLRPYLQPLPRIVPRLLANTLAYNAS